MRITTVPATKNLFTSEAITNNHKRRVAGYARVSTDHEDQLNSYEAQVNYYTKYIQSREDWEFVKVYADEGITGCNTKARAGFNSMVSDALNGQINLIVTKSVSRFARNTVDSLSTIRKLKEVGCEVYFEKESIWTFDARGELLITIMSSLAQEEARSISENTTWGRRKRFADGKPTVPFSRFLGYERGPHGELVVNQEQAEIVRLIYNLYLRGLSTIGIAKELTMRGIKTATGKDKWCYDSVLSILKNEKYAGNAILQKQYTESFLTKKMKKNEGQVEKYFVENSHEAIITPEQFQEVQEEIARRAANNRFSCVTIFSSKLKCGQCGSWYGSKTWHSNKKYRKTVFACNRKLDKHCTTPHFTEEQIKELFIKGFNHLIEDKESVLKTLEKSISAVCDNEKLDRQRRELEAERLAIAEKINKAVRENAMVPQNQDEYEIRHKELTMQYEAVNHKLTREIPSQAAKRNRIARFLETLKNMDGLITEFDDTLWATAVDYMTVYSATDIHITFKSGVEVKI